MLLAIDCGNTNTVFSIWDGTAFIASWRMATQHQRTADEYYVWLSTLKAFKKIESDINHVIISSTVPRVVFNLRVLADRYFDTRPYVVGKPDCLLPVDVRVDAGTQVGPDRLVNTVAGFDRYGGDLIVVDFGTATTFDVVAKDGAYIGGVIAPGVNLSLAALHSAAETSMGIVFTTWVQNIPVDLLFTTVPHRMSRRIFLDISQACRNSKSTTFSNIF